MPPDSRMSHGVSEHLVLEHLRAIRADIHALHDDNRELKARVNEVYSAVLSLRRDQAQDADTTHRVEVAVDGLKERIERIERRLDLRDG